MRISTILTSLPLALVLLVPAHGQDQDILTGEAAFGSAEDDTVGIRRHITSDALPQPSHHENDPEEPDFENAPTLVDAPEGTMPEVPDGFSVEVFATGLTQPRVLRIAPNGDIFVAESEAGRISVFAADAGESLPAEPEVFVEGLDRPFGIAFYPPENPEYIYVGEASQVVRFPYSEGDRQATGQAETIIPDIPTERHWTRDLAVSPDGTQLYVSIGSASNVAGAMPDDPPEDITEFEQTHGVGAAWGDEENRAVVRVFDADGGNLSNFATGLRNCSGMAFQPGTNTLWCTGNERDHIGPDLAPDYLTTVEDGGFYGWPWYYSGSNEDPAHAGERPELADRVITPDVLLQAHSSTMQLVFYEADAFPEEYRGDIFATMRGSWNREYRTGYKVIRALMEDGRPTGVYEDFMIGFALDEDNVWGRPTGIAVTPDGALLVSDDANGTIFRITHSLPQ